MGSVQIKQDMKIPHYNQLNAISIALRLRFKMGMCVCVCVECAAYKKAKCVHTHMILNKYIWPKRLMSSIHNQRATLFACRCCCCCCAIFFSPFAGSFVRPREYFIASTLPPVQKINQMIRKQTLFGQTFRRAQNIITLIKE